MIYADIARDAQGKMGACKACLVCDGRACKNTIPGPGAKGKGTSAIQNYAAWQDIFVEMDTICDATPVDVTSDFFGVPLALPVMVAPVGDVERHYGTLMDMGSYNKQMLAAAAEFGSLAWTGDGVHKHIHAGALQEIEKLGGRGVCTIKPWSGTVLEEKLELAFKARPAAIAMDIDGAGLPFLRGLTPAAGPKSKHDLEEIAHACHVHHIPFIVKGVMAPKGADKAFAAGVDAIVVSNHGGRVQDGVAPTAHALPRIREAVGNDVTIFVDGGIRSGVDVFKALALGANAALICRSFVVSMYARGKEGVKDYFALLQEELHDTMQMCGVRSLTEIDRSCIALPK